MVRNEQQSNFWSSRVRADCMAVDLHLHSTASDGTMEPAEIVEKASELGLSTISITDHDSFAGIDGAIEAAQSRSVDIIPGVELSAYYRSQDVHVIGYFVDRRNALLNERLSKLRESRGLRAKEIVVKLQSAGVNVEWSDVERIAKGEAVGRPHIAQALVDKGEAQNISEVFKKHLGRGRPGYVAKYVMEIEEILDVVHQAGGVTSLAHPAHWDADEAVLRYLQSHGLDAIEVWHIDHSEEDVRRFNDMASRLGLLMTGGSDCHGERKKHGMVMGSLPIPDTIIDPLRGRAQEIRASLAQ